MLRSKMNNILDSFIVRKRRSARLSNNGPAKKKECVEENPLVRFEQLPLELQQMIFSYLKGEIVYTPFTTPILFLYSFQFYIQSIFKNIPQCFVYIG